MMSKVNVHRAVALTLVLVAVGLLVVADEGSGNLDLVLDRGDELMIAGGSVGGVAQHFTGEFVEVRMYIDGELVEVDEDMEGSQNEFEFNLPGDSAGKFVTIEAVSASGEIVQETFRVRPNRG